MILKQAATYRIKKQLMFIVFFGFLGMSSASDAGENYKVIVEMQLKNARNNIELVSILERQNSMTVEVREKLAQMILRNIINVNWVNPKVSKLKGETLETICLLSSEKYREFLSYSGRNDLNVLANNYLDLVEPIIKEKISELQKTMKGSGCNLSPISSFSWE